MSFPALKLTSAGKHLINKALLGTQLNFTKIAVGDGHNEDNVDNLTDLNNKVMDVDINAITMDSGYVTITGVMNNSKNTAEWWWSEIGIYADDPDNGEVLYAYSNAGDKAEHIPAYSSASFIQTTISVAVIVGAASNISATLGEYSGYITAAQFKEHTEWLKKHDWEINKQATALANNSDGVNGIRVTENGILQYWDGEKWRSVSQSPIIVFHAIAFKEIAVSLYKCDADGSMDDSTFISAKTKTVNSDDELYLRFPVPELGTYRASISITLKTGVNDMRVQNIEVDDCTTFQIELA